MHSLSAQHCQRANAQKTQDGKFGTPTKPETFETAATFRTGTRQTPWKPGTTFGTPEPGSFPKTAPARPEHTEIYIVQRPHSILLLGNNASENVQL